MNNVNHPSHYQSKKGIEVIDVMTAFTEDLKGVEAVDTAQVIKYILRWHKKNGVEDLEKAIWYTQHLIDHLKKDKTDESNDSVDIVFHGELNARIALFALKGIIESDEYANVYVFKAIARALNGTVDHLFNDIDEGVFGWTELKTAIVEETEFSSCLRISKPVSLEDAFRKGV